MRNRPGLCHAYEQPFRFEPHTTAEWATFVIQSVAICAFAVWLCSF